jgi:uncharacterized membrane protein
MVMCAAEGVIQRRSRRSFVIMTCHERRVAIAMAIELAAENHGATLCKCNVRLMTIGFSSYRETLAGKVIRLI